MGYKLILFSTPNLEDAKRLSRILIDRRLASSVMVLPNTIEFERYNDLIEEIPKTLCLAISIDEKLIEATKTIHTEHGMDTPMILLFDIVGGSKPFLEKSKDKILSQEEGEEELDLQALGLTESDKTQKEGQ